MTTKKPLYRVSFCPIDGANADGSDRLGRASEIGAVWNRANGKGAIMRLKIVPENLARGVILLQPVTGPTGGAQ